MLDLTRHPCFDGSARHQHARVHLPVAPKCNIRCNFCDRRHDCLNESRPGVTSRVLTPVQAEQYLDRIVTKIPQTAVVGIAGPGDPFANAIETLETLRRVRASYPEMLLCVATNGLELAPHADALAELQVSHVTVTVNAADADIGARIYAWVRDGKTILRGQAGAARLLERQKVGIEAVKRHGMIVKVNFVFVPGVNDVAVDSVAQLAASLGADRMNVMPFCPVEGTPFAGIETPSAEVVDSARALAERYLPQMRHCMRCRADAAGMLGEDDPEDAAAMMDEAIAVGASDRPCIAVGSHEGLLVNRHLGEAPFLWIYRRGDNGGIELVERRAMPEPGGGDGRWLDLARRLQDCRALLVSNLGQKPRTVLEQMGLQVHEVEGLIEDAAASIYEGRVLRCTKRRAGCGSCSGAGGGCA